ncbi:MAG: Fe-S cluster assembly protein SufD, partial [Ktedonobacterales bacterium]
IAQRDEPEWMRERRRDAWKTYLNTPMPTRQDEEWRRTDLRDLKLDQVMPFSETQAPEGTLLPEVERNEPLGGFIGLHDARRVEYRLDEDLVRKGVIFTDLATAVREHGDLIRQYFMTQVVPASDSKFAALHGAFWDNGVFLYVPRGVSIEVPLRAVTSGGLDNSASMAHTLIVLDEMSQATFAEDFTSPDTGKQGFSSRVSEVILKRGANLQYVGVQRWGRGVRDFHTERVLLGRDSTMVLQSVELGSKLSKGRVEAVLKGDGANVKLFGLYVEDGQQHFDRYTLQDHIGQSGVSDLLFKGVLTDKARSVYSGLIRVEPGAKKTAAYQQNRNLLLSRTARADSIPNLEIKENDILGCTHGATVGKVDPEQVFYLMCRGLTHADATRLIVEGFVDPLVAVVPIAGLRDALREEIQARVNAQALE